MKYLKRRLEKELAELARAFPAVVLSGPRQSGKSTTLKKLFAATHQYITFDDPVIRNKCVEDPKLFFDSLKGKVILDEIQYVPQILSYVKISIDENRNKKGRYIITGSQQFNLIKNLTETLAGRTAILNLYPLNCLEAYPGANIDIQKIFTASCLRGSFPEIFIDHKINPVDWYGAYLQTYLERDVRGLHNVGNLNEFQRFLQLLAARCSQAVNLSSLANDLGVAVNTVKNWLSILRASQIIFFMYPYYRNIGKRIIKSPKVYFIDCGLVAHLTGLRSKEHIFNGPLAGALFENFVVSETYKIISAKGGLPRLDYLRTVGGEEIDLIIEADQILHPYEIKLTKSPRSAMIAPLENIISSARGAIFSKANLICLIKDSLPLTKSTKAVNAFDYFKALAQKK